MFGSWFGAPKKESSILSFLPDAWTSAQFFLLLVILMGTFVVMGWIHRQFRGGSQKTKSEPEKEDEASHETLPPIMEWG